jgi:speckle-type POZ protein
VYTESDQIDNAKGSDKDLFVSDIACMLDDEILADFSLESSDGEVLKAHKFILAARSPVLFAMVTSDMKEAQERIAMILDFNAKVLKELLRFIYSGVVENLDEIARKLIYAAEKYQFEDLKQMCIASIVSSMTKESVAESLLISEQIPDTDKVFNKCADVLLW